MAKRIRVEVLKSRLFSDRFDPYKLKNMIDDLSEEGWEYVNCQKIVPKPYSISFRKKIWAIFESDFHE